MQVSLSEAKALLRPLGITINKTAAGEYRVNFKGGKEETAAYETDVDAAYETGEAMWRCAPGVCPNCGGYTGMGNQRVTLERCSGCYDPDDDPEHVCEECGGQIEDVDAIVCRACQAALDVEAAHQAGHHDALNPCQMRHCPGCRLALEHEPPLAFHELEVGATFEFYHGDMPHCDGTMHGPWVKVERGTYRLASADMPIFGISSVALPVVRT